MTSLSKLASSVVPRTPGELSSAGDGGFVPVSTGVVSAGESWQVGARRRRTVREVARGVVGHRADRGLGVRLGQGKVMPAPLRSSIGADLPGQDLCNRRSRRGAPLSHLALPLTFGDVDCEGEAGTVGSRTGSSGSVVSAAATSRSDAPSIEPVSLGVLSRTRRAQSPFGSARAENAGVSSVGVPPVGLPPPGADER